MVLVATGQNMLLYASYHAVDLQAWDTYCIHVYNMDTSLWNIIAVCYL